jgi:hypothetical protein
MNPLAQAQIKPVIKGYLNPLIALGRFPARFPIMGKVPG